MVPIPEVGQGGQAWCSTDAQTHLGVWRQIKSQYHDFALSRLGKFCAERNAEKGKKRKEEDLKEQKKVTTKDFTKVKSTRPQRMKEKLLPWEEFVPAEETKLMDIAMNKEARQLDDDAPEDARGYKFVAADNLPKAFGEYVHAKGPIALITLKPSEDVLKAMKTGIEKTRKEVERKTSRRVFPEIEEAQMCLFNRKECRKETRTATILNMNASRKILPRICAVPTLLMQANPVTELSVSILEPMCYDLGLESWCKSVFSTSLQQLKEKLVSLVDTPSKQWNPKEAQIIVRRNRALNEGPRSPRGANSDRDCSAKRTHQRRSSNLGETRLAR